MEKFEEYFSQLSVEEKAKFALSVTVCGWLYKHDRKTLEKFFKERIKPLKIEANESVRKLFDAIYYEKEDAQENK